MCAWPPGQHRAGRVKLLGQKGLPFTIVGALTLAFGLIGGLVALAAGLLSPAPERAAITRTLDGIAAESTAITASYFAGPETSAQVVADAITRESGPSSYLNLLRDLTLTQPNVEGTYIGFPDGGFLDVRWVSDERLQVKTISFDSGTRSVHSEIIDGRGRIVERLQLEDDEFDPRERPWFQGAAEGDSHWTEPYLFFTSQEPGITHSTPALDESGNLIAIVGVDIALTDLESFLTARKPTENGGAAVLNAEGEVIAGTSAVSATATGRARIDQWLSDSAREPTSGRIATRNSVAFSLRRVSPDSDQVLLVEAPEADFLEDVRTSRQGLATLAALLGAASIALLVLGSGVVWRHVRTLDELAQTDSLTGLLNRAAAHRAIETALRTEPRVAVLVFDLDDFKGVNDFYGHQCGDETLSITADRLRQHSPPRSSLARLGGDEFCVLLIGDDNPDATFVALVAAVSGEFQVGEHRIELSLSAGYAEAISLRSSAESLLRQADIALYQSKAKRGSWVTRHDPTMTLPWKRSASAEVDPQRTSATGT